MFVCLHANVYFVVTFHDDQTKTLSHEVTKKIKDSFFSAQNSLVESCAVHKNLHK